MRFPAPLAAPLLAAGLACIAGQAAHAGSLNIAVNHSVRLPVTGRAASVIVGNAEVADVAVVDSHTVFVTGKGAGSTDVAVVDPLGRTVFAADILVTAGAGRPVTVHRAGEVAELSCDPRCLAPAKDGSVASQTAAQTSPGQAALGVPARNLAGQVAGGLATSAASGGFGVGSGLPPVVPPSL